MAIVDRARSFWSIVKAVSVSAIDRESRIPVAIAIVGAGSRQLDLLNRLFPDDAESRAFPSVRLFDSTSEADGFPAETGSFDIVLDAGGGRAASSVGSPVYGVDELGGWGEAAKRILDDRPDLALSLARRFPGFREEASRRIIHETALANAEFSMMNALPGLFPLLGILLPTAAIGDIVLLAKNQAMMLFRLAAAHGLPLDTKARSRDLAPLLGNAFGWRAIARELVGVVPGGVGLVARGAIAYAGTVALGEAIRRLYALGQQPTRAQIARLYRESLADARATARSVAGRLVGRRKQLPPAPGR